MRYITLTPSCFSGGTVDTADLESAALKSVEVQIFSGALDNQTKIVYDCLMRNWCSGNIPSFQVGVTGSNPVFRSEPSGSYSCLAQLVVALDC